MIDVSQNRAQQSQDRCIRATYEEYALDEASVAMISDPENEYAWIQSDQTIPIVA